MLPSTYVILQNVQHFFVLVGSTDQAPKYKQMHRSHLYFKVTQKFKGVLNRLMTSG